MKAVKAAKKPRHASVESAGERAVTTFYLRDWDGALVADLDQLVAEYTEKSPDLGFNRSVVGRLALRAGIARLREQMAPSPGAAEKVR